MKLIIDIPEGDYLWIKNHVMTINESRIANGTPLDKIRAEIEQYKSLDYIDDKLTVDDVLQIIDKI